MLADVGDHVVALPDAGFHFLRLVGRGDAGAVDGLVLVGHLDQFVADVRGFFHPVVVGDGRGRADQHVAYARLADVAAAVIAGEAFDQQGGEVILAVHEDVVVGDEDVAEDHHRFLAAVAGVAYVQPAFFHAPRVAGLRP
jgi:hypothetical protein